MVTKQFSKPADEGALVNSLLGGSNMLGRVVLPLLTDLTGTRKPFFVLSAVVQVSPNCYCFVSLIKFFLKKAIILACLPNTISNQSYSSFLIESNLVAFMVKKIFCIPSLIFRPQFFPLCQLLKILYLVWWWFRHDTGFSVRSIWIQKHWRNSRSHSYSRTYLLFSVEIA
jgi:hypothetical protein